MKEGQEISIFIGGAVCFSAVAIRAIHGTITQTTEKAVKITANNLSIWLPKKALVCKQGKYSEIISLARWFRADSRQEWAIEKMAEVSGISA